MSLMLKMMLMMMMILLMMMTLSVTAAPPTKEEDIEKPGDHRRVRRLTVRNTLDYGCSAFSAVKECTDLITDCGDVCDNVHAVCTRFSRNSKLITELCSGYMLEVRKFVENELPKLAQAGPEVEKALREIGDHFESLGDQILNGLTDAFNDVVNWFDFYGAGNGPSDSLVAMVTCMILLTIVNMFNQ